MVGGSGTYSGDIYSSGTILNNSLTGAFGYGIAMSSAFNFTIQNNYLFGTTSFVGSRGPNCTASDPTPPSASFIVTMANVTSSSIQSNFQYVLDADGLTCVQPLDHGNIWNTYMSMAKIKRKDSSKFFDTEGTNGDREAVKKMMSMFPLMFPAVFVDLLQHLFICLIQRLQ